MHRWRLTKFGWRPFVVAPVKDAMHPQPVVSRVLSCVRALEQHCASLRLLSRATSPYAASACAIRAAFDTAAHSGAGAVGVVTFTALEPPPPALTGVPTDWACDGYAAQMMSILVPSPAGLAMPCDLTAELCQTPDDGWSAVWLIGAQGPNPALPLPSPGPTASGGCACDDIGITLSSYSVATAACLIIDMQAGRRRMYAFFRRARGRNASTSCAICLRLMPWMNNPHPCVTGSASRREHRSCVSGPRASPHAGRIRRVRLAACVRQIAHKFHMSDCIPSQA